MKGSSINLIKPMMARQNTAKKRSIDGYVSILSCALMPQARLQWIYRSALNPQTVMTVPLTPTLSRWREREEISKRLALYHAKRTAA